MAMQRYNKYQYETSPRKLEPEYKITPKKYNKPSTAPKKKQENKNYKAKTVSRKKVLIALFFVFTAIFTISLRNSQIDEAFNKNEELKQAYLTIEKENEQMEVDIENTVNLSNIEQQAKELLGMQTLSNKQTVYVNLPKKDYIQPATESVVIEEENNILDKIINKIKEMI
jgi:predicted RND superfamily exporter protein